ncbi:MAG: DUF885 family protein [Halioglobus sp.]
MLSSQGIFSRHAPLTILLLALLPFAGGATASEAGAKLDAQNAAYRELVAVFDDLIALRDGFSEPSAALLIDSQGRSIAPVANHGTAAVELRYKRTQALQDRLDILATEGWPIEQRVDYLAVRSRLDQYQFLLRVSRPWARDPGLYVDRMWKVTFTELPVAGEAREEFLAQLRAIPVLVEQAKQVLDDVAADYADLALHNLSRPDGVGHGHPYRSDPPAGVIGWFEDLLARAEKAQPELVSEILTSMGSVTSFESWLTQQRPTWIASAGVGSEALDWYLRHVKLMPWSSSELVVLGERELDRLWADYALERQRNRDLPELLPAKTEEDYQQRIERTDQRIRTFLSDTDFITVPDDVGQLGTNVPWIERPGGRNFWEEVQYRDPSPDHLHAVIPGHRFDMVMAARIDHPIRSKLSSGARVEGWATYLEEAALGAGLFADLPRVRELIQVFGIFRAARVPADVWLQTNQMTVAEAVAYWLERVPYLDPDVARVDAEIYLRRPPGYGIGYTVGALQMQGLLAERKRQLGDDFNLREFHDAIMQAGQIPLSLLRWEMTGRDDEVQRLWTREPMPGG